MPTWPRGIPKCQNNGTCVDRVGGYHCNCPPGFTGERCEGDINECRSNPCNQANSLDCIQLPNDYQCVCKPGFTGESGGDRCHGWVWTRHGWIGLNKYACTCMWQVKDVRTGSVCVILSLVRMAACAHCPAALQ